MLQDPARAAEAIDSKRVAAVLHLPQNFSADILAGRVAQAQLLIDARRSNTSLMVQGYATAIVGGFAADLAPGQSVPVSLLTRDWFNPNLESQWFILPGLVSVLSMMMAMLVSALSLARERELWTFEQLLVTPLRPAEILVGKALPGMIVGLIDANIVVTAALLWFRVPFLGNMALLQGMLLVYMLAGVAIGLVISSIARTQQQAMLGVFVIASPMVVLSGYAAPVENMPAIVAFIGQADPIRWMLVITRGLFLQDMPASLVLQNAWPLVLIGGVAFGAAWVAVRRVVS
jgi:ABC-2 type transport system permease protein